MTFVTLSRFLYGCGDVEDLIRFCDLIGNDSIKPYHGEFLQKKLLSKVRLWPVYLEPNEISRMVRFSFEMALRKHLKLNPAGPLPNMIWYFPKYNTIRYRTRFGTIMTLDLTTSLFLIQGLRYDSVLKYSRQMTNMPSPFCVNTDHVLFPDEVCNLCVPLGEIVDLISR